jgi:hyperosmotically inducible periplasmic protein
MNTRKHGLITSAGLLFLAVSALQLVPGAAAELTANDSQIQAELTKSLSNQKFRNVHASVENGIVSLTGTVNVYNDKADADKKARKLKNVSSVQDQIEVGGPQISDQALEAKLVRTISYDRVGYGTTTFNAISVNVQNGVVTLGGSAYGPVDKQSALIDAGNMPGVKEVVDRIQVDPLSRMDDRVRIATARAIYGFPSLNKYAIDPARPIRIAVQNGNVTLLGVVDTKADKDVAGLRANSVPGVFKVTNDLQVANQPTGRS